jgi:hypothetical protein
MTEENILLKENVLPNKMVTILIVVALLVTIIGSWTVLNTVNNLQVQPMHQTAAAKNVDGGQLSVAIIKPMTPTNSGGDITLNIV